MLSFFPFFLSKDSIIVAYQTNKKNTSIQVSVSFSKYYVIKKKYNIDICNNDDYNFKYKT
ncbi:hypothetical protein SMNUM_0869 [Streptococcus mutans LP13]|nr:hypothetical protein SMNUM_0869 [Streptococcus mutans LP13]